MRYIIQRSKGWGGVGVCWVALLWGGAGLRCQAAEPYTAYLMAYFGPEEKLFYAWSEDARHWKALNGGRPVFDSGARLRDPFMKRVKDRFHLVHTKGWDHPTIYHWESKDLIHWEGGPIDVVPAEGVRVSASRRSWVILGGGGVPSCELWDGFIRVD